MAYFRLARSDVVWARGVPLEPTRSTSAGGIMRCNALVRSSVLILFAVAPIVIGCDSRKSTANADDTEGAQAEDMTRKRDPKVQAAAQDQRLETDLAKPG